MRRQPMRRAQQQQLQPPAAVAKEGFPRTTFGRHSNDAAMQAKQPLPPAPVEHETVRCPDLTVTSPAARTADVHCLCHASYEMLRDLLSLAVSCKHLQPSNKRWNALVQFHYPSTNTRVDLLPNMIVSQLLTLDLLGAGRGRCPPSGAHVGVGRGRQHLRELRRRGRPLRRVAAAVRARGHVRLRRAQALQLCTRAGSQPCLKLCTAVQWGC